MKIVQGKNSWRSIQSAVKNYVSVGLGRASKSHVQKLRPDRRFISWPHMPKRQIDALVGYESQSNIEISVLEEFVARCERKKIQSSYEAQLVGRSFDEFSMLDMKRAVDIERMVTLLKATLTNMKAIAAINGSYHKG